MDQGNTNPAAAANNSPTPASMPPAQPAVSVAEPTVTCKCPTINPADWDKKRQKINKVFHKTFSPRLFFYPFSFVIDVDRATRGATRKGYNVVDKGMVLDTGGMFWGSVMVEVTNANLQDKSVVSFENREVYTKACKGPWNEIKKEMMDLKAELGAEPLELYTWWTSCPKCLANKDVKAVLIAVTAQAIPQPGAQSQQSTQPAPQQPTAPAQQAQQAAPQEPAATPAQPAQPPQVPQPPPAAPEQPVQPAAPSEQPPQNPPQG